jgi:hypothetical protein
VFDNAGRGHALNQYAGDDGRRIDPPVMQISGAIGP